MKKMKIVIGITGASGAIYGKLLLKRLEEIKDQVGECGVVFSENSKAVWKFELGSLPEVQAPLKIYEPSDFFAPMGRQAVLHQRFGVCDRQQGAIQGKPAEGLDSGPVLGLVAHA